MDDAALMLLGAMLARFAAMLMACGAGRAKFAGAAAVRCLLELAVFLVAMTLARSLRLLPADARELPAYTVLLSGGLLGSALLSTAVAERARLRVVLVLPAIYALVLLPMLLRLAPVLIQNRFIDDSGVTYFHLSAGLLALVASLAVGPREGRFERDGSISVFGGHQLPMVLAGLVLFVAALALATALICKAPVSGVLLLLIAGAVGLLSSAAYSWYRFFRIDPYLLIPGTLASSLACSCILPRVALVAVGGGGGELRIVLTSALVAPFAAHLHLALERRFKLDDMVGVVSAELVGPIVGVMAATLTVRPFAWTGQVVVQGVGLLVAILACAVPASVLFFALSRLTRLRVSPGDESEGLDLTVHDLNAYPDFSQPMIRSHHNREA